MTRNGTFDARARRKFEVPQTFLYWTFPTHVSVFVCADRNTELASETVEITCSETTHSYFILLKCVNSRLGSQRAAWNVTGVLVLEQLNFSD